MPISFCRTNWNWRAIYRYFGTRPACQRKVLCDGMAFTDCRSAAGCLGTTDILTELADRLGFLDEYNKELNRELGFRDTSPNRLKPGKEIFVGRNSRYKM